MSDYFHFANFDEHNVFVEGVSTRLRVRPWLSWHVGETKYHFKRNDGHNDLFTLSDVSLHQYKGRDCITAMMRTDEGVIKITEWLEDSAVERGVFSEDSIIKSSIPVENYFQDGVVPYFEIFRALQYEFDKINKKRQDDLIEQQQERILELERKVFELKKKVCNHE